MKTTAPTHSSIHASTSACMINEEGSAEKNDVPKNLQAVKNMSLNR